MGTQEIIEDETERTEAAGEPELTREQKEKQAFDAFDKAVAEVRKSLTKGGHLELVTSEGYRAAQKKLIGSVGDKTAEVHLSHWFARNMSN